MWLILKPTQGNSFVTRCHIRVLFKSTANHKENQQINQTHWRQARGNVCDRLAIGIGFSSDWMKKWREIFSQLCGAVIQNGLFFDTRVKTTLYKTDNS